MSIFRDDIFPEFGLGSNQPPTHIGVGLVEGWNTQGQTDILVEYGHIVAARCYENPFVDETWVSNYG